MASLYRLVAILFLHSYFFSDTVSFADSNNGKFSSYQKLQAEKLIRGLNLFPDHDVNIHVSGLDSNASRLVETRFEFPLMEISGDSIQDLGHRAGYYRLLHSKAAKMFYFFFESRNSSSDPVVIWLTGGPGCGSELALFYENGPFHITHNLTLVLNEFGWDKVSNLIYVDQPVGTGFSYSSYEADIRHDEEGVSTDLYDFLQAFFEAHPQFTGNDFYITGESYAGHYIPALATRIHQGNKNQTGIHINLKGLAIGNGMTNQEIQYAAYTDYALHMKLITKSDHDSMNKSVSDCLKAAHLCGVGGGDSCDSAYTVCNEIFSNIIQIADGVNYYDIRKKCEGSLCYDFSNLELFLNLESVKNMTVYNAMINDWMRNLEVGIPALLEDGIKLLVYAGEYDLICNWLGNKRWVEAMKWSGQKQFWAAKTGQFTVRGMPAGLQKEYGPLTLLKFYNSGHLVPMDQPEFSLEMLKRWMMLGKL